MRMLIKGVVQGVGFRPFVHNLAQSLGLKGLVKNTAWGIELEVEGKKYVLADFARHINTGAPPLAIVEKITSLWLEPVGYESFIIAGTISGKDKSTFVSPDMATCPQCLAEFNDPRNRRYRYPFINCTNCGPRFTIIKDIPYDRLSTTMADFPMCPECLKEYNDPRDRRFHAQPNACPVCGPHVTLSDREGRPLAFPDPAAKAAELLQQGNILAIKGLGGYHLACDAMNSYSVQRLRALKNREAKPFAVMMPNIRVIRKHCLVSEKEEQFLKNGKSPIVLLKKKSSSWVSEEVAPRNQCLGVMLPYTPLHHLLFAGGQEALVMTSGNSGGEAIEFIDCEVLANLNTIADYFLTHNRDIHIYADDSVVQLFRDREMILRRSRGFVPLPVKIPFEAGGILALGAELKNTLCVTKKNLAFLSQHIGDLKILSNLLSFEKVVKHLQKIFGITLVAVVYDLHPDYLSGKYAREMTSLAGFPVQHHHAHIASCMAENGLLEEEVIGVALDGAGYGLDGNIWGGEFFTGNYRGFNRRAHLAYVPLPGGAAAIRQPWRMAVSYLTASLGEDFSNMPLPFLEKVDPQKLKIIRRMVTHWPNTLTSSAGRLFDAVAALLGLRLEIGYEGQAAIELEQLAAEYPDCKSYEFDINKDDIHWKIQMDSMFNELINDLLHKSSVQLIASRFHKTVVEMIVATCKELRHETGIASIALSGGVFQNMLLLSHSVSLLEREGFKVYTHSKVPANDGGICLGQAVIAGMAMAERGGL